MSLLVLFNRKRSVPKAEPRVTTSFVPPWTGLMTAPIKVKRPQWIASYARRRR